MGEKGKIDLVKLDKMLREGCSGRECAEHFGVYPSAITQAKQKLKSHIVRTAAMEKSSQVVEAHLDMAGQLRRINQAINDELDRVQKKIEEAGEGEDITKLQEMMVKLAAEVRKQLNAQVEIFEAYRDFKDYEEFRNTVIDILAKYHPKDRNEAIKEFKQRGLLRGTAQISQ